jgi:hypothetical protein
MPLFHPFIKVRAHKSSPPPAITNCGRIFRRGSHPSEYKFVPTTLVRLFMSLSPLFRVPMPVPDGPWIVQSPTYGLSSLYMCYGWRLTARLNVADEGANGSGVGGYGITMRVITLVRAYSSILYTI